MMSGLISVGVFWSIIAYHVNKNKQNIRTLNLRMLIR